MDSPNWFNKPKNVNSTSGALRPVQPAGNGAVRQPALASSSTVRPVAKEAAAKKKKAPAGPPGRIISTEVAKPGAPRKSRSVDIGAKFGGLGDAIGNLAANKRVLVGSAAGLAALVIGGVFFFRPAESHAAGTAWNDKLGHVFDAFDGAEGTPDDAKALIIADPSLATASQSNTGFTILHHAATAGDPAMVSFLLDHGADVNAADQSGQTPLLAAMRAANNKGRQAKTVAVLLAKGANAAAVDKEGNTALHVIATNSSADPYVARLLKEKLGATAPNAAGKTPAQIAQDSRNSKLLSVLQ